MEVPRWRCLDGGLFFEVELRWGARVGLGVGGGTMKISDVRSAARGEGIA